MRINHWYHWATGLVFFVLAMFLLWLQPTVPVMPAFLSLSLQKSLGWVLLVWSLFRGYHGYLIWKRSKIHTDEED